MEQNQEMGYHETLAGNTKRGNGDQYELVKILTWSKKMDLC